MMTAEGVDDTGVVPCDCVHRPQPPWETRPRSKSTSSDVMRDQSLELINIAERTYLWRDVWTLVVHTVGRNQRLRNLILTDRTLPRWTLVMGLGSAAHNHRRRIGAQRQLRE